MKPESFEDHDRRPIGLIEYEQHGKLWMPHSVFVSHAPDHPLYCSTFDFNWSKTTGGLYYHESGSGGGPYINGWPGAKRTHAKLWWDQVAAPKLKTGGGEEVGAADLAGLGFDLVADPIDLGDHETNPFLYGIEGDVIYCTKCRDHLPESDVCEHVFWCEKCQEWGGAEGNKEHCRHRKPTLG